jgi:hypothetical protein
VRKVGSDTGGIHNIVQSKLVNQRASLQQKGERLSGTISRSLEGVRRVEKAYLANATRGAENNLNRLAG